MSLIIGLTGPTGAGKSSLTLVAEDLGFKVIDCDKIARRAVEKGSGGLGALTQAFGEDILLPDGSLNRKKLAARAFSSGENTRLLNKTLFPFITELVEKECITDKILLDAPTLIESGLNGRCDVTVGVLADADSRIERICKRDGITRDEALLRMNAGKPNEFYKENCDFIIYNNGEPQVFKEEFAEILKSIKER